MGVASPVWDSFYGGINLGGAFSDNDPFSINAYNYFYCTGLAACSSSQTAAAAAAAGTKNSFSLSNAGFIGGGQLGFNTTIYPNYIFGIEGDIQGISESNRKKWTSSTTDFTYSNNTPQTINTNIAVSQGIDYLGTVRGRLGYLFQPTILLSATGGFAYGGVRSKTFILQNYGQPENAIDLHTSWSSIAHYSSARLGWTIGANMEWMPRSDWSLRIEYLYYNLGAITYTAEPIIDHLTTPATLDYFANVAKNSTRFDGNIVRLGINYHFV
jgi:outer membrane immunogenic protein